MPTMNNSLYGAYYRNRKFSDIWETAEDFVLDYKDSGVHPTANSISDTSATTLFYLLYSEYGNSVISSSDETQFKYQIFSTIYCYGPAWEKKLDIQSKLRALDLATIDDTKVINNHALNPGTEPTTEELDYISDQNTSIHKRSSLDKYGLLYDLINKDETRDFLTKFKRFFLTIVYPETPLWYVSEEEEEDDEQ